MCSWAQAALPAGVWIRDKLEGECCEPRIEITEEGNVWLRLDQDPVVTKIEEAGDALLVQAAGLAHVLKRTGADWTDEKGRVWRSRDSVRKIDPSWTEVEIRAEDQQGKALADFAVRYSIESETGRWDPLLVLPLRKASGPFVIKAPTDCKIAMIPEHPEFVRGYGSDVTVVRKDGAKELKVTFQRGRTIRGEVVDAETGKPLPQAEVSPVMFTPPLFSPDRARRVVTDAEGWFVLRGVRSAVVAGHPDYVEETAYLMEDPTPDSITIRMHRGLVVRGVVSDESGNHLEGVSVDDGSGREAVTDASGKFELRGLRKWDGENWYITFQREGFDEFIYREAEVDSAGLAIRMRKLPVLRGKVVDAQGQPVGRFRILCGPGPAPADFECESVDVESADGAFSIVPDELPEGDEGFWIGVRAQAAAPWEGVMSINQLVKGEAVIRLQPGRSMKAKLVLPKSATGELLVTLKPLDRKQEDSYVVSDHAGVELATGQLTLKPGDPLVFKDLRAGKYQLVIRTPGATPLLREVTVGVGDLDLGDLRLVGTGTIFGSIDGPYVAGKPWQFADGEVRVDGIEEPVVRFKTDKNGRFRVDGIPSGKVDVWFPFMATADIVDARTAEIEMPEGGEVEVRFKPLRGEDPDERGIPADLPPVE